MTDDPVLTSLYVPGTQPDRFDKAMDSGADVVVLDLQDSVVSARKDEARRTVRSYVAALGADASRVEVRVNAVRSAAGREDLRALADAPRLSAIRLPSVAAPAEVVAADAALDGTQRLQCTVESALGLESSFAIAQASPAVCGLGLGEADLTADLGLAGPAGLTWARGRIVVAARAAGLPPPAMSVYPVIDDAAGLRAHCRTGRELGFLGCSAIHPRQLPVIVEAFLPTAAEIAAAQGVIAALSSGARAGHGAVRTEDGRMVDAAMERRAGQVLALARRS